MLLDRQRIDRDVRRARLDVLLALVLIIGTLAYLYDLIITQRGLDPSYIQDNLGRYVAAAGFNLYVTSVAFVVGMAIGFGLGWLRTIRVVPIKKILKDFRVLSDEKHGSGLRFSLSLYLTVVWAGTKYVFRRIGDAYVEIIRGTPIFVQILFAWSILVVNLSDYFANPNTVAFAAGVLALTANTGGYQSEIFRAGLQTVHSGQVEAARAIGFSRLGAMRSVVLPQALRLIVPPLTNEYIGLFKASSLLFILGIRGEITFLAYTEAFRGHIFEIFAMITAIFLLITVVLAKAIQAIEQRYRIPGLGIQQTATDTQRLLGLARPLPRPQ